MPASPSRALVAPLAALAALLPAPALAWGKTGHRVVAQIADARLTPRAHRAVKAILGVETLAEASNWPDTMRSDPAPFWQRESTPWHYVTVPPGKRYAEVGAPPEGDAVTALTRFGATLRDPRASLADRQRALRFVVHIVGDLHQPLHAGDGSDRGGNDRKVTFFGRATNLHSVWDSALVDDEQLSFTEMTAWLSARVTPVQARDWAVTDPRVWIAESSALRDRVYPAAGEDALSYRYVYENTPRMELQLEKGGVRLAAYLNELFAARRR
ncbi:S1/P1 nuclease [Sphingomonas sp. RHCKR7]|uniref:S1/P1 nuclease n=1 Tax=Sphingomonas folli TaxID=2862497 RepID=UPI001CA577F0|nr:S1/P1 nuclease [Sphingomonas folli]MBW6527954.1 S1/P1 nuclease [Sphingomonas folli]